MPTPLIYVMGPSGSGKTWLMDYVRSKLDGRRSVAFAHHSITRPLNGSGDAENYTALSPSEGTRSFAWEWQAYGFDCGIGTEITSWVRAGLTVVVGGSRAFLKPQDLAPIVPVLLRPVAPSCGAGLPGANARTCAIEQRLERAAQFTPADLALVTLDNSGPIDAAGGDARFRSPACIE